MAAHAKIRCRPLRALAEAEAGVNKVRQVCACARARAVTACVRACLRVDVRARVRVGWIDRCERDGGG